MHEEINPITEDLRNILSSSLNAKRYAHTLGVAAEAVKLAQKYGADVEKAELSGLFHDFCRNMPVSELDFFVEKFHLDQDGFVTIGNRALSHGKVAAFIANKEFGIHDQEILYAIAYHTTGRANMGILEKVIYLADVIEPGRKQVGVEVLREIAYNDLDEACLKSFDMSIMYVLEKNEYLHPETISARNDLLKKKKRKDDILNTKNRGGIT